MCKRQSNYQDFIKLVAIILMLFDHSGLYFYPYYPILRVIGRGVMPIFCFCAGYNFVNRVPSTTVLSFGLLIYVARLLAIPEYYTIETILTIYLGQYYIYLFQDKLKTFIKGYCHVIILGVLFPITYFIIEYGTIAIAIMILGYITHHDSNYRHLTIGSAVLLSLYHSIAQFDFVGWYLASNVIVMLLIYVLMVAKSFDQLIGNINIWAISRNSLFIYFAHLIVIYLLVIVFSVLYGF